MAEDSGKRDRVRELVRQVLHDRSDGDEIRRLKRPLFFSAARRC